MSRGPTTSARFARRVACVVAMALDATFLLALAAVVLTRTGAGFRADLGAIQLSVTSGGKPLALLLAVVLAKVALGPGRGLFAAAGRRSIPVLSPAGRAVDRLERGVRTWLLGHRAEVALALLGTVAALGLTEAFLRVALDALPHPLANHLVFPYDARRDGIFRFDPETKMLAMRPHYERDMWFNGYRWRHRTDARGFRNPVDRTRADVVLLGDSMIYGHGVEEEATVRHHLERELRRPVANLGIQGASIHQEYQAFRRVGVALQPRYAFLFFLVNDLDDLAQALSDAEMARLLALPVEDHETPYVDRLPARPYRFRLPHLWRDTYTYRALEFFRRRATVGPRAAAAEEAPWEARPPFRDRARLRTVMRAHLRLLQKTHDLADRHGIHFVNLVFWSRVAQEEEAAYDAVLAAFSARHGIPFYSLRVLRELPVDADAFYLPGDGHLSDLGARWTAAVLAGYVRTGRFDPHAALATLPRTPAGAAAARRSTPGAGAPAGATLRAGG